MTPRFRYRQFDPLRAPAAATVLPLVTRGAKHARLAVETMDAHVRETMQFLASRWRALAAEAIASNEESPNGNGS